MFQNQSGQNDLKYPQCKMLVIENTILTRIQILDEIYSLKSLKTYMVLSTI